MPEEAGFDREERERVAKLDAALEECWDKGVSTEAMATLRNETGMPDWQPHRPNERKDL